MNIRHLTYTFLTFLFSACGLHYEAPSTPESRTAERRAAIAKAITEAYAADSLTYINIAYGQTEVTKPLSYKKLDSLYEIKYALEQRRDRDLELEREIQIQRQIALNDTAKVQYVENHLFGLQSQKETSVYFARIACAPDHTILNMAIDDSDQVPSEQLPLYQAYLFEESILYPGNPAEFNERKFYERMKSTERALEPEERKAFREHVFYLMKTIQRTRNTRDVNLIQASVIRELEQKGHTARINDNFERMEELYQKIDGREVLTGYKVEMTFREIKNDLAYSYRFVIQLNEAYLIESIEQI